MMMLLLQPFRAGWLHAVVRRRHYVPPPTRPNMVSTSPALPDPTTSFDVTGLASVSSWPVPPTRSGTWPPRPARPDQLTQTTDHRITSRWLPSNTLKPPPSNKVTCRCRPFVRSRPNPMSFKIWALEWVSLVLQLNCYRMYVYLFVYVRFFSYLAEPLG